MTENGRPLQRLVIVGHGGHGRETLDIVEAINAVRPTYHFAGFLDDGEPDVAVLARRNAQCAGSIRHLMHLDAAYVIGIGSPAVRRRLDEALPEAAPTVLVHPRATVGSDVRLGPGGILASGASVTTNVRLGRHVHMNVASTVAHDCRVGHYVSLSPGVHLGGCVSVGDDVFVGTGAVVNPGVTIGSGSIVGAGAVVIRDVPPAVTVVGVPARVIRRHDDL